MKKLTTLIITAVLSVSQIISANAAADYTFKEKDNTDYYRSTLYEDVYGSTYNYGGQNVTDFYDPLALPGLVTPTPQTTGTTGTLITDTSVIYGLYDESATSNSGGTSEFTSYIEAWETPFTSVSELKRSDGSIGTLYIPSLNITRKVYEGTGSDSMSKGLGHFPENSGWDGNVGLCGHNRGSSYAIGSVKNLKTGDTIRYTTVLGTRTYAVSFVGTISSTDWSYLATTYDNRITLITCLADQPSLRVVVVAVEI